MNDDQPTDPAGVTSADGFDALWALAHPIPGRLTEGEAALLHRAACYSLRHLPETSALVEVGSYHGRSTVVPAGVMRALRPDDMLIAIDPYESALSGIPTQSRAWACEVSRDDLLGTGLLDWVEIVRLRSTDVLWSRPVGMVFIDGLPDHANVTADFGHFRQWVVRGGLVAFVTCPRSRPDVVRLVAEVVAGGDFVHLATAGVVTVLQRES